MPTTINGTTGVSQVQDAIVTPQKTTSFNTLGNYANDAAAQAGGVAIGGMYRNGSVIQVRVA